MAPTDPAPIDDATAPADVVLIRRTLQASVARLMDAGDHLAGQRAALDAAERRVRALALRETSRSLAEDPEESARLSELQAATNVDFRQMREAYAVLAARIEALLRQHEALYDATFAPHATGRS